MISEGFALQHTKMCKTSQFLNGVLRRFWNPVFCTQMDALLVHFMCRQRCTKRTRFSTRQQNWTYVHRCLQESRCLWGSGTMLTVSIHQANQLNERRKISGAMLVDKAKLMASLSSDGVSALFFYFWGDFSLFDGSLSYPRLRLPNRNWILLLIWILTSCFRSGDLRVTRMKWSARMEPGPSEGQLEVARKELFQ